MARVKGVVACVAVLMVVASVRAHAQATLYECAFAEGRAQTGNWVAPKLWLTHDPASGAVRVNDGIIESAAGGPIEGKVVQESARRITFGWAVRTTDIKGIKGTMAYRLTWYRDRQEAGMSVKPIGFDNTFSGQGSCRLSTL